MEISILTLFPEMFSGPFAYSIVQRAQKNALITIRTVNIRDFGIGKHKIVDAKPFGGGTGMIMRVDVIDKAIQSVRCQKFSRTEELVILLDARGNTFQQKNALAYTAYKHLILICGHYEGVDERVRDLVDQVISIGDFILTGGEIPAMLVVDAVVRLVPGVLKNEATINESFSPCRQGLLEYPQYTLPRIYKGKIVPDILLSGNHKKITAWKIDQAKKFTEILRPGLFIDYIRQ